MCHNPPQHSRSVTLGIWFTFARLADPSWSVWVQTRRKEGALGSKEHFPKTKLLFRGVSYQLKLCLRQDKEFIPQNCVQAALVAG